MNRRQFLQGAAAIPLLPLGCKTPSERVTTAIRRVRPGEPGWPSLALWEKLKQQVDGRLVALSSPLEKHRSHPQSRECAEFFQKLKNPYHIGDDPGLTQTSGWIDAWTSAPGAYAVAAAETGDIVAAVNFARKNNLRLVVKGGGHSYQGTSCSADSLVIWTRAMNKITLDNAFVPQGCEGTNSPQPAVTIGAGAIWAQAYQAVTTEGGRYVQGGGCTTVGVAGLIQSGGFGNFSKNYGLAAAGLLQAEVVTADGAVRIANACTNSDLFWALKGGGGGSLGVVTHVTLRTRDLPEFFGGVFGSIRARSDSTYRKLIARTISFYREKLFNPHWGEQIRFGPDNTLECSMVFQGLRREEVKALWSPFVDWIAAAPGDFSIEKDLVFLEIPARHFWDAETLGKVAPAAIHFDDRSAAPKTNFLWAGDHGQVGWVIHGYKSAWLPASLLDANQQASLAEALFACSRHVNVSLHFNKGLAGARAEEVAAARDTATNPAALDAFALAIIATGEGPAFAGIEGHEPNIAVGRQRAREVSEGMQELLRVAGIQRSPASYVSESDFFEQSWQRAFWGTNYPRLAAIKKKYDPTGLFFVHHGVGSEDWSADGFVRVG